MLGQTWVDFEQKLIEATLDQWCNHPRSCVHADGGHFKHML